MISRRFVMAGLPAAAVARAPLAHSATRCTAADARGNQQCVSGLEIGKIETVRQRCRDWCWVACIQAGAQGEHKLARGYEPVITSSVHFIPDPGFRRAVAEFLERERAAVRLELEWAREALPNRSSSTA